MKILIKHLTIIVLLLFCTKSVVCCPLTFDIIKEAVERQLRDYPKSSLQDLYKSFFQDRFGPGHIVSDTSDAGNYLRKELNNTDVFHEKYYEPTGYNSNYYRVNLSVLKENKISYNDFFDAFIRSVRNVETCDVDEWKKEWSQIESVIISMNLNLEGFEEDSSYIHSLLEEGKYAVHHSKIYNDEYHPHYRIIEKEIFEKEILPIIKETGDKQ